MSDNVTLPGTGVPVATDDVGGVQYQKVKIVNGASGVDGGEVTVANPFPVIDPDQSATGTITATDAVVAAPAGAGVLVSGASTAGSLVALACPGGDSAWVIELSGTMSGTYYFEESANSTNGTDGRWVAVNGRQTGVVNTVLTNSATTAGLYRGNTAGVTWLRVRNVGGSSPSTAVIIRISAGTGAIFLNASIPAGTNAMGTLADVTTSGNLTSTASITLASLPGTGSVMVQVTGTWAATLQFEATLDGTNYFSANGIYYPFGAGPSSNLTTSITANGQYIFSNYGFTSFRVRASAYTSGTAVVTIRATNGSGAIQRQDGFGIPSVNATGSAGVLLQQDSADGYANRTTGGIAAGVADAGSPVKVGGKYNSALPTLSTGQRGDIQLDASSRQIIAPLQAGTAIIGKVGIDQTTPGTTNLVALAANQSVNIAQMNGVATTMGNGVAGTGVQRVAIASDNTAFAINIAGRATGGSTTFTLISAATTNATSLKASAGTLKQLSIGNNGASACYVKFYNKATAPTVGTDTPVATYYVPATSGREVVFPPEGNAYGTGIAYAITGVGTVADTTAVAAAQVFLNGSYV